jgi:hypothetical protein
MVGDIAMAVLIVTTEKAGIDKYSQEIAKRLDVTKIESRRYLSSLEAYRLARLIGHQDDIVHLPSQNLARYALFVKNPFILTVHDLVQSCFRFGPETIRGAGSGGSLLGLVSAIQGWYTSRITLTTYNCTI